MARLPDNGERWLERLESLGGSVGEAPVASKIQDGRLEVFTPNPTSNLVYHKYQYAVNGTTGWSGWGSIGTQAIQPPFRPTVGINADGRQEVFALSSSRAILHAYQTTANGGWSGWSSLGGYGSSEVAEALNYNKVLEIFVIGSDGGLYHKWQTSTGWSGWAGLGAGPWDRAPVTSRNADGRAEVFTHSGGHIYHRAQAPGTSTGWGNWSQL